MLKLFKLAFGGSSVKVFYRPQLFSFYYPPRKQKTFKNTQIKKPENLDVIGWAIFEYYANEWKYFSGLKALP